MALVTPRVNHRDPKQPSFILSQPGWDARFSGACASQCPPARTYRNIPTCEADVSCPAEVAVVDPRHPLYGGHFRVVRLLPGRGGVGPSYEVEHRSGCTLLVPVAATECREVVENRTKLSVDGLRELISLTEQRDEHADRPRRSMGRASGGNEAAGRRRGCRGAGGGAP
jgi:hypothetical protein